MAGKIVLLDGYSLMYFPYYQVGNDFSHPSFDSDEWTHIVITVSMERYISDIVCLYVNGNLIDRQSIAGRDYNYVGKGTKFIFGGSYEKADGAMMTVDNLRIYKTRALSDKEVRQIYEYER